MKKTLLILLVFIVTALSAQQVRFKCTYGGTSHDYGRSAKQTFDHGYIAAGSTSSFGNGNMDMLLLRTDSLGGLKWVKTYGGSNVDWGYCVRQTKDTGYVIAGYTNSFGAGGYDFYLVKTDSMGNVKWAKTYGGTDWDFAYSVEQTSDGGYILAGGTYSDTKGDEDVYLVKTNAVGDTLWTRKYGGVKQDEARSVKQTSDGGYILTGFSKTAADTMGNVYIIKTDVNGDTIWTKKYGGAKSDFGNDIIENTFYNTYIVVGGTNSFGLPDLDFYLLRLKMNGDTVWTKIYKPVGIGGDDVANGVTSTAGNDFAFIGSNYTGSAGLNDAFFFKFEINGYYLTATTHGTFQHDEGFSIFNTSDKGFIICGYTDSTAMGFGLPNLYLVKTDSMGFTLKKFIAGNEEGSIPEKNFASISPNPLNNFSTVTLSNRSFRNNVSLNEIEVTLFDALGRNVSSGIEINQVTNRPEALELKLYRKEIKQGIYFMNIVYRSQVIGQGKLIIVD